MANNLRRRRNNKPSLAADPYPCATDFGNHLAAIKMVKMQGGVFGAVSDSKSFMEALPRPRQPRALA